MQRIAILATCTLATSALAQSAITVDVDQPTLLPGESTTVTLLAGFPAMDYAMAGLAGNFVTSVGSDGWSDATVLSPMDGPGTTPGAASASGWDGIIAGQLNFPATGAIFADPTNPMPFWRITYTAPVDVATPFTIDLSTMTIRYDVYIDRDSSSSESRLADLVEGSATIRVIPAPASALVLALGTFAAIRRR